VLHCKRPVVVPKLRPLLLSPLYALLPLLAEGLLLSCWLLNTMLLADIWADPALPTG
jgi:hypothetical protein